MSLVDRIAEQRITEAMQAGEFENLPGRGRKICLDEDDLLPAELRAAYRILKNSGYLPPQAAMLREIADIEGLLAQAEIQPDQAALRRKLNYLLARASLYGSDSPLISEMYYQRKYMRKTGKP